MLSMAISRNRYFLVDLVSGNLRVCDAYYSNDCGADYTDFGDGTAFADGVGSAVLWHRFACVRVPCLVNQ